MVIVLRLFSVPHTYTCPRRAFVGSTADADGAHMGNGYRNGLEFSKVFSERKKGNSLSL